MLKMLFAQFLTRNRLFLGSENLAEIFIIAFFVNDRVTINEIESRFPGFDQYRKHLEDQRDKGLMPSPEELADPRKLLQKIAEEEKMDRQLPDEQYCKKDPYRLFFDGIVTSISPEINLLPYLLKWSDLQAPAIADIGCGICHHLIFAKKMRLVKGHAIGIDASDPVLRLADKISREEKVDIRLVNGNCVNLPLADNSIGQIWMITLLPWVIKWERALDEAKRVLTPKGRIIIALNKNDKRCVISVDDAVAYLKKSGFSIDDATKVGTSSYLIAAGKN